MKRHYLYKNYLNFDYYSLITLPHWYTTKIMKKKKQAVYNIITKYQLES